MKYKEFNQGLQDSFFFLKTPSDFEKELQKSDKPKNRDVYLPKGCNRVDYWTGDTFEGGKPINLMLL